MRERETIAYLGGNFDLLHAGHLRMFKLAKKIADIVIVSLNTDDFSLRYKGKLPIMPLDERLELLRGCKYVDRVVVNAGGYDSRLMIEAIRPDFIIHGDDWIGDAYLKQMGLTREWLDANDIAIIYTPYQDFNGREISSSLIKERIKNEKIHTGGLHNSQE